MASDSEVQIVDYFKSGGAQPNEFAIGLHNEFQPLSGHDIGQFPGLECEKQTNEIGDYELVTQKTGLLPSAVI